MTANLTARDRQRARTLILVMLKAGPRPARNLRRRQGGRHLRPNPPPRPPRRHGQKRRHRHFPRPYHLVAPGRPGAPAASVVRRRYRRPRIAETSRGGVGGKTRGDGG